MFHHFCDYVNLYASQHVNGSWNRDIHIIMWNTVRERERERAERPIGCLFLVHNLMRVNLIGCLFLVHNIDNC